MHFTTIVTTIIQYLVIQFLHSIVIIIVILSCISIFIIILRDDSLKVTFIVIINVDTIVVFVIVDISVVFLIVDTYDSNRFLRHIRMIIRFIRIN